MAKRRFTKYPSNYVKASSDFTKRIYVYYRGDTGVADNLADAILEESLEKYGAQVNFEYTHPRCRSYGDDVSLCIITSRKSIAKSTLKNIIQNEFPVEVVDIIVKDFETSFF